MPKRAKRLTKRERKDQFGKGPSGTAAAAGNRHIHCIACGRHIDPAEMSATPPTATVLTCEHGSQFASCVACVIEARSRLEEHDRSGQPPRIAEAWH